MPMNFVRTRVLASLFNVHRTLSSNSTTKPLEITVSAQKKLASILKPHNFLRVEILSGGCHGFQYKFRIDSSINNDDIVINTPKILEADSSETVKVVVDTTSLELVQGSQLDYSSELIGSSFQIINNPKAGSGCGCGTSFDVK